MAYRVVKHCDLSMILTLISEVDLRALQVLVHAAHCDRVILMNEPTIQTFKGTFFDLVHLDQLETLIGCLTFNLDCFRSSRHVWRRVIVRMQEHFVVAYVMATFYLMAFAPLFLCQVPK